MMTSLKFIKITTYKNSNHLDNKIARMLAKKKLDINR